jgi:lactate dehydrogenase-like 2-hydroxyacid dehydrogenase
MFGRRAPDAPRGDGKKFRIVVTRKLPEAVEDRLRAKFTVALNPEDTPFTPDRLTKAMQMADGMLCAVTDAVTAAVLNAEGRRRARIVANFGVGVNNIDLDAAKAAGVAVSNTPDVLTDATADLAIALTLSATRRMSEAEALLRSGGWDGFRPTGLLGAGLQGRTLGIIGMGRIGQAVARRANRGFGMKVVYQNRSELGPFFDFAAVPLGRIEDVMEQADIVSLHVPGGVGTRGMISAEMISRMRRGAYLINTARGDVVDEQALIAALREGRLAGAGLDVFRDERNVPTELLDLPGVTLLPHIGSATVETRTAMGMLAVDNLEAHFAGRDLPARVV